MGKKRGTLKVKKTETEVPVGPKGGARTKCSEKVMVGGKKGIIAPEKFIKFKGGKTWVGRKKRK